MTRNTTNYNEIIGVLEDGTAIILDYIFEYEDGFKGATHIGMGVLDKNAVEDGEENETEYARELWVHAVANDNTEQGLEEYAKTLAEDLGDRERFLGDDASYRQDMDEAYEKLSDEDKQRLDAAIGKGKDFVDWDCHSCGRIGKDVYSWKWAVLFRPDLVEAIKKVEPQD